LIWLDERRREFVVCGRAVNGAEVHAPDIKVPVLVDGHAFWKEAFGIDVDDAAARVD
jgi:hypothetical protein